MTAGPTCSYHLATTMSDTKTGVQFPVDALLQKWQCIITREETRPGKTQGRRKARHIVDSWVQTQELSFGPKT